MSYSDDEKVEEGRALEDDEVVHTSRGDARLAVRTPRTSMCILRNCGGKHVNAWKSSYPLAKAADLEDFPFNMNLRDSYVTVRSMLEEGAGVEKLMKVCDEQNPKLFYFLTALKYSYLGSAIIACAVLAFATCILLSRPEKTNTIHFLHMVAKFCTAVFIVLNPVVTIFCETGFALGRLTAAGLFWLVSTVYVAGAQAAFFFTVSFAPDLARQHLHIELHPRAMAVLVAIAAWYVCFCTAASVKSLPNVQAFALMARLNSSLENYPRFKHSVNFVAFAFMILVCTLSIVSFETIAVV